MSANLLGKLPLELLLKIYSSLDLNDQVRFSSAARHLREIAIHQGHLFRAISVAIRDEVASISALVVAKRDCDCGQASADDEGLEDDDSDDPTLPDMALTLIRISSPQDGTRFPGLEKLVIQFPDTVAFGPHHESLYFGRNRHKDGLERLSRANDHMVDLVLGTLADPEHPTPHVKALSILHLPPVVISEIGRYELNLVLSRVDSFKLSIFGEECILSQDNYRNFFNHFPSGIFDQLSSVKSLKFHGSPHAPLGILDSNYEGLEQTPPLPDALARSVFHMPFLEKLELSNVAIGQQLENLFYNYSKDPRKKALSLRPANVCADAASAYTWARFFSRLVELRVVIHRFELVAKGDSTEALKRDDYTQYKVAEFFTNFSPTPTPSWRRTPRSRRLIEGEDQAAYDAFMATVKVAAAAAAAAAAS
ncbi:hypothetical protein GGTG_07199 [Gaeumannomyces tritici R3-111a-1]|uniref:F-box domain-containing protein n=1 Tax=Gaeumannomyces tritici (strain R3-111a-1) TaxID=644352 RepID=J3P103_GAET3|nr:hypothetical protein GGTG_07199 [Gaeumannomyces tritici R3-111a-1]EJT77287.1 hypothetical protein GGTG_07199 [Gaeumannomyces tritici R3-111a-1]